MRPLTDCHAHTELSYCADGVLTIEVYRAVLDDPGCIIARQALTNHGFQAYFPPDIAWSWEFLDRPALFDRHVTRGDERLLAFKEELENCRDDRLIFGVEVELMGDGRLTISDALRAEAQLLLGSLHVMPRAYHKGYAPAQAIESFFAYLRDLAASGIDVIAHPFRWLRESDVPVPQECVEETVAIAKAHGLALELSARSRGEPAAALIKECAAAGVPLALATDAHSLAEVGRLQPVVEQIERAGFTIDRVPLFDGRSLPSR